MTQYIDPQTTDIEYDETDKLGTRLAFQNAYRLKKKTLIAEIQCSLGFDLGDMTPSPSAS